jgi:hypothetical protein
MPQPKKGEKQKDFITRCMGDAEANSSFPDNDQRAAFCYSQYKNKKFKQQFNFSENGRLRQVLPVDLRSQVVQHLRQVGVTSKSLEDAGWRLKARRPITNMKFAVQISPAETTDPMRDPRPDLKSRYDSEDSLIRYAYSGPYDNLCRDFCSELLELGMLYRREDIDLMSFSMSNPDFGYYSIWNYCGSYNCRHSWEELEYSNVDEIEADNGNIDESD